LNTVGFKKTNTINNKNKYSSSVVNNHHWDINKIQIIC